jgi:hypothetical protein
VLGMPRTVCGCSSDMAFKMYVYTSIYLKTEITRSAEAECSKNLFDFSTLLCHCK